MSYQAILRCLIIAIGVTIALINPPSLLAQNQQSGYRVEYLDSWPRSKEIKFIRIRIVPLAGTSAGDFDFHVVAKNTGNNAGVTVSTVVSIRKGDTSATGELYVPVCEGYNFTIHTELDGDHSYDRSDFARRSYYDYFYNYGYGNEGGLTPTFIFASSKIAADECMRFAIMNRTVSPNLPSFVTGATAKGFPETRDIQQWYSQSNVNVGGGRSFMDINGLQSPLVGAMSLESLPSRWYGYDGLDLVLITYDDLQLLAQKHPGKLLAIERWVASSGRVVVLNCGKELEKAEDALKLLGDSDSGLRDSRKCTFLTEMPDADDVEQLRDSVASAGVSAGINYYGAIPRVVESKYLDEKDVKAVVATGSFGNAMANGKANRMIAIDFEKGQVVCVCDSASQWKKDAEKDVDRWGPLAMFLQRSDKRAPLENRVLNDYPLAELGFPEFAEPPRFVFESAILLYLLLVGPVTFFVLKRRHKLNLMFVVVPVISSVFCTTILAYAIFAEGFDTRVNLFTFTELNQVSGRQTTSSMAHVYSGMTPSPYQFDGASYGLVNLPYYGRYQRIHWNNGQEISGGEIRARTNHQLFSKCSNETDRTLAFTVRKSGDSFEAFVRNDFDSAVDAVAFVSDDCKRNEAWLCERIEPGQTANARKLEMVDAARELESIIRAKGKTIVMGLGQGNYSVRYGRRRGRLVGRTEDSAIAMQLKNSWNMKGKLRSMLNSTRNRKSFVAITSQSTNYDMPIDNAKVESEIHVVHGVRR